MLDEASGEIGVQDGTDLFGENGVQSVGTRLNFAMTCRAFAVVQFGRRKDVRVGDECNEESIEGSGIPASRIQCEVYPTNMGRYSVPEAKEGFALVVIESA